jgi:hypothetical protein
VVDAGLFFKLKAATAQFNEYWDASISFMSIICEEDEQ